jgi:hypothetical protein
MDISDFEDPDEYTAYLVGEGALELYVGEDGETYFNLTDKTKELAPEFYDGIIEEIESELLDMYLNGLVQIEYDENLEVGYTLTEQGKDLADEVMNRLNDRVSDDSEWD